ncbi:MAG: hypothetical protein WA830_11935, partial [Candidatus Sulfotelmatobacter sp.]
ERDGSRYAYRLTQKGVQVALLFLFFHKRLCGPLANSRFHHRPDPAHRPNSRLEAAYLSPRRHRHPTRRRSLGRSLKRAGRSSQNVGLVLSMILRARI